MKKQPDKITAYYYRAANKQTDLNLDNQMHRLLSHAQENGTDTYMFFVDNGYSGLIAELQQRAARGEPVKLTLCGERNAVQWQSQPRGLLDKIKSVFGTKRLPDLREML